MAKDYDIAKTGGRCAACERELAPGEAFLATVREGGEGLVRYDYCPACADKLPPDEPEVLAVWRSKVPQPQQKRRLLVDDDVLVSFFERLAGAEEEAKVNFRFVLALILMRKKLLIYDRLRRESDGREVWLMHFRGQEQPHEVLDPKLDDERIAEVSGQLGQVMEVEL
jgi:hypothetical protein